MANVSKKVNMTKCKICLEDMTIEETVSKDEVRYHDVNKLLQDLASMGTFNLSYDNKADYTDIEADA